MLGMTGEKRLMADDGVGREERQVFEDEVRP